MNDEVCDLVISESESYTAQQNETIKIPRMKFTFLSQLFFFLAKTLNRVNGNTGLRDNDLVCLAVPGSMTRNRFEETKCFLHFADIDCLP